MLLQHLPPDDPAVHIAFRIDTHAFRAAVLRGRGFHILDEILHRTIFGAADANSFLPARLVRSPRLRISNIDSVVTRDRDAARPPKLPPCRKEAPVLIEDLNTIVVS